MLDHSKLAAACSIAAQAAPPVCQAHSPAQAPTVLELYTSEGCSSCPPAEKIAGELARRPELLVLTYHVTYWDDLGWRDRFGQCPGDGRFSRAGRRSRSR